MDWGVEIKTPTMIYEDNKQVIKLVKNGQVHTRAKYLAVKLRALHDLIIKGHIAVDFIASRDQWADMFTKSQLLQDVNKLFSRVSLNAVRNREECEQWIPPTKSSKLFTFNATNANVSSVIYTHSANCF